MRRLLISGAILLALAAAGSAAAQTSSVVMSGLDNPRGLAVGPEGALYVAEAGRGGPGPCVTVRDRARRASVLRPDRRGDPPVERRAGPDRDRPAVLREPCRRGDRAARHRVPRSRRRLRDARIGARGAARSALAGVGEQQFGCLGQLPASGGWRPVADIAAHEFATNPGGGPLDSNPYGLLAKPGGRVVADAAANALLRVAANGDISTIATFPSRAQGRPTDAVPTAVAVGPDRAYHVAELTGVPFAGGAANIYRVLPGRAPTVRWSAFTTVIDITFAPDGGLYVLEHSTGPAFFALPGRLLKLAPDGTRTTVIDGLARPGSVALGPDGARYVSSRATSVGSGQVLRIEP